MYFFLTLGCAGFFFGGQNVNWTLDLDSGKHLLLFEFFFFFMDPPA